MKDIRVLDANGKRVFELTNNGEISISDGYSVIVNGSSVVKDKDGDNENGGFFNTPNSFLWIMLLLLMFSGDANSKDMDLLTDAFCELKESKKKAEEEAGAEANNADG